MKQNLFETNSRMKLIHLITICLFSLTLFMFQNCKKEKGINQIEWQNESLSLTSEICKKFRDCADTEWKTIPEKQKKFTEGMLDEANCQKRFRESNGYKLIGEDPIQIQTSYKKCHKQVMLMSCKDLQNGKIQTTDSCIAFQKIQNR
ncbi:hypothetical protein AB3N60_00655 [Leptospira sp. WS39.C2]